MATTVWRPSLTALSDAFSARPISDLLGTIPGPAADPLNAIYGAGANLAARAGGRVAGFSPPSYEFFTPRSAGASEASGLGLGVDGASGFDFAKLGNNVLNLGLNIGAGIASDAALGDMVPNNAGRSIGSGIGGFAGSFLGPPGTFLGSSIGGIIGSYFGPKDAVGPVGHVNFGNEGGMLTALSAGADNGLSKDSLLSGGQGMAARFNAILRANGGTLKDLPQGSMVKFGEYGADPSILFGDYMAPMLNENSLGKALIRRGLVSGNTDAMMSALGGPDPERIFTGSRWVEPESIHPVWQGGVYDNPYGYKSLDTGRVGNIVQDAIASGVEINDYSLAEFARTYDPLATRAPQQNWVY